MRFRKKTRDGGIVNKDTPASRVIAKFGGLANMSEATGISSSTLWGWALRGDVPPKRVPEVKWWARELKIKIKDSDFLRPIAPTEEFDIDDDEAAE